MAKLQRGNRDLIKAMNRNLILNIVRQKGPLSRTQLTQLSNLSVGSVSQISNELLDENWLIAAGESDYTGGRRQEMLHLNPHAGHVIGLKLTEDRIICVITDLESKLLFHSDEALSYDHSVSAISQALVETVEVAISSAALERASIKGLGIGLAGVIDHQSGVVHYSPYFHWRDVQLAQMVAERVAFPVYLENDVNTLTVSEQLFGVGHETANFVVITVGRGIGMGMVLDHRLYKGTQGGVGEIGHLTLDGQGANCECGKRGCLEALAADPALLRYVSERLKAGAASILSQSPALSIEALQAAARGGDSLAEEAYQQSGHYLGLGLSMVVNLIKPDLIVLSGESITEDDPRLSSLMQTLRQHSFNGLLDQVQIIVKPTDQLAWARGAASVVVDKLFESPVLEVEEAV